MTQEANQFNSDFHEATREINRYLQETRKPLFIRVITRNLQNPDEFKEKRINFLDSSDRQWLAKHCWWAMHNKHSVTTYSI